MKKFLYILFLPIVLYGCGTNIENSQLQENTLKETTLETTLESSSENTITIEHTQDTLETTITSVDLDTTTSLTSKTTTTTVTTTQTTTITTTTAPAMGFDDNQLLLLAQNLHDVACEMAWNYYSGTPYALDYDFSVQDEYGNTYFLVEDSNITSIDDIKEDWLEIFSDKYYTTDFGNRFLEKDGKVYVNDGSRGADIYYSNTEITGITSKSEDGTEVFFKAVSHYVDPNDNTLMEDKVNEFSIILEDGSYHVGKFTLPY